MYDCMSANPKCKFLENIKQMKLSSSRFFSHFPFSRSASAIDDEGLDCFPPLYPAVGVQKYEWRSYKHAWAMTACNSQQACEHESYFYVGSKPAFSEREERAWEKSERVRRKKKKLQVHFVLCCASSKCDWGIRTLARSFFAGHEGSGCLSFSCIEAPLCLDYRWRRESCLETLISLVYFDLPAFNRKRMTARWSLVATKKNRISSKLFYRLYGYRI